MSSDGDQLRGGFRGMGVGRFVPAGERVIVSIKPSLLFVVLWPLGGIVVLGGLAGAGAWVVERFEFGFAGARVVQVGVLLIGVRLIWQGLEWLTRLYVLTDKRVVRVFGVLQQRAAEIPLDRIQHVVMYRSVRERIFGLGTIGFATAGTGGVEVYWVMVARPHEMMERARKAIDGGEVEAGAGPIVIGIAGGIGSGKSAVAEAFGELGCVVVDSDRLAREALDLPRVRRELVGWWGERVLDEDGKVDRGVVASIVFEKAEERERLEGLIHPLVKSTRVEMREQALGAAGVVVDAPLLFEAGLDSECDVVVFVEVSRAERLARVKAGRGWDEGELARREKAQMSVEAKRDRADYEVSNEGDREDLPARVGALFERIKNERS